MPGHCNTTLHAELSRRTLLIGAGASALFATGGGVRAAAFPGGPVRFVVGLSAGSSPDVVCRIVADQLSKLWGQQTIVLNQPGATGGIAMRTAGTSAPDGHTLLFRALVGLCRPAGNPIILSLRSRSRLCTGRLRGAIAHGHRGVSIARHQYARRIHRAGKATSGPDQHRGQHARQPSASDGGEASACDRRRPDCPSTTRARRRR